MTPFSARARASLAFVTIGGLILMLVGLLLGWFGLVGYKDWDMSQRVMVFVLGAAEAIGFGALLLLALRQQIVGQPPARLTARGLAVGSPVIPWDEIDDIVPATLFALPHVAIVQRHDAPKRLTGLRSLQYMPLGGQRVLFLSERQLGTGLEAGIERLRAAWSRARAIGSDRDRPPGPPKGSDAT